MRLESAGGAGAEIDLSGDPGESEADPEGDSEELARLEVGEARGGKEDAHDGARGRDAEEDGEGTGHPCPVLGNVAAQPEDVGAGQREDEERVEDENGDDFDGATDGVSVHDHGCDGCDGSEGEEDLRDAAVSGGVVLADA